MAGYLQMLAPGISAHVVNLVRMARVAAKWDQAPMLQFPDPGELGVRTNEHLQYTAGGFVGLHTDDESVYTIVVALSEPDAYEGGEYVLYDADDPTKETLVKLPRLSALVFLSSLTSHGVAPVTSGLREMFAAEFWEEDDVPHTALRPNIQEYHEQVLGEVFDEAQGDL
jgi:2OG-Fe(II) oxygenase superfamily